MNEGSLEIAEAVPTWRLRYRDVLVVAIDGYGGAGKTTIAGYLAAALGASIVHTDDFFTEFSPELRARFPGGGSIASYYDWARLRAEALEPLRRGEQAVYSRFDWEKGSAIGDLAVVEPADVVLLEGVYASGPHLEGLFDTSVFVDTPEEERLNRLRCRIAPADWDANWLAAERAYFADSRPSSWFDLVVRGTTESLR